jgi:hypothetical protein
LDSVKTKGIKMSFPSNPADGATHTIGATQFTYNLETNQWLGATALTSGGGSGGGGSMGAPSHYGRFTFSVSFIGTNHVGGNSYFQSEVALANTLNVATLASQGSGGYIQLAVDESNYGTAITAGGTLQDFSGLPQFCSDADYLASNPTYFSNNPGNPNSPVTNGNYYCSDNGGYVRYTNDSGATFNTYIPQIQSNGKIKLALPGKYRIRVKHLCDVLYLSFGGDKPYIHTYIFVDGAVKSDYIDRCDTDKVMDAEYETLLETTAPDTEFSMGLSKLGGDNTQTTSLLIVEVESLF